MISTPPSPEVPAISSSCYPFEAPPRYASQTEEPGIGRRGLESGVNRSPKGQIHGGEEMKYPHIPRWKRGLDLGAIVIMAPVLAPAMLLVAIVIRLVSRGPILFRQGR